MTHTFLLEPGVWLGDGEIELNVSAEKIRYHMRWTVEKNAEDGTMSALQEVEIGGEADAVRNRFSISEVNNKGFTIELKNQDIGEATGRGIIADEGISWEFRFPPLEGFEHYTLQDNGTYLVHAEYAAASDFRTKIKGKLWRTT